MAEQNLQHNFQSLVFYDPSEIIIIYWIGAHETCLVIINV